MTIWTKQSPPTRLPEAGAADPGAGWSGPVPAPPGILARLWRWTKRHSFGMGVLLPTLLAAIYFFAVAAPQYVSEARFVVRGRQAQPANPMSEMISQAGFKPVQEEAMGVRDYLRSHDAVAELRQRLPLVEIYRRPEADLLARLWWEEPSAERLLDYFTRMIAAEYDTSSGITTLKVRAFRAEDARQIAQQLLGLSEGLVNRLNHRIHEDALRVARDDLARAEARVAAAQTALTSFRQRERQVDPSRSAALALETVGRLEGALAQSRAELQEAQNFARGENPRIVQLRNRVAALERQVAEERRRISSSEEGLSQQIGEYERLNTERELARVQLTSATNSLERARVDAQRQQIFVLRVVEPNLAERARYPRTFLNVLYVFLCLSVVYGLAWLMIAGTREHAA